MTREPRPSIATKPVFPPVTCVVEGPPEAADTQKGPRPPACVGEWEGVREGFGGRLQADDE